MKLVVFDWDRTLADDGTTDLFSGSKELLAELIENRVKVCIVTARPGQDPTPAIHKKLMQQGINIKKEDVIWAGAQKYQGHTEAGQAKAEAIKKLRINHKAEKNEILFVDDRKEYVEAVQKSGVMAIQVPENCLQTKLVDNGNEYVSRVLDEEKNRANRLDFFAQIKNTALPISAKTDISQQQDDVMLEHLIEAMNNSFIAVKTTDKTSYDNYFNELEKIGLLLQENKADFCCNEEKYRVALDKAMQDQQKKITDNDFLFIKASQSVLSQLQEDPTIVPLYTGVKLFFATIFSPDMKFDSTQNKLFSTWASNIKSGGLWNSYYEKLKETLGIVLDMRKLTGNSNTHHETPSLRNNNNNNVM